MPVVSAKRERTTEGGGWRWLLLLPVLLVLLLLVPLVRPVVLHVGDRWLLVESEVDPLAPPLYELTNIADAIPPWGQAQGFSQHAFTPGVVGMQGLGDWEVDGAVHLSWLRIGSWSYGVAWFDGRRARWPP